MAKFPNWDYESLLGNSSFDVINGNFKSSIYGTSGGATIGKRVDAGIDGIESLFKFYVSDFDVPEDEPIILTSTTNTTVSNTHFVAFLYRLNGYIRLSVVEGSSFETPSLGTWKNEATDPIVSPNQWHYFRVKLAGHTPSVDGNIKVWLDFYLAFDIVGRCLSKGEANIYWIGCKNTGTTDIASVMFLYDNFFLYNRDVIQEGTKNLSGVPVGRAYNETIPNYLFADRASKQPIIWDDFTYNIDSNIWYPFPGKTNAQTLAEDHRLRCALLSGAASVSYRQINAGSHYPIAELDFDFLLEDMDYSNGLDIAIAKIQRRTNPYKYDWSEFRLYYDPALQDNVIRLRHLYRAYDSSHTPKIWYESYQDSELNLLIKTQTWNSFKIQLYCGQWDPSLGRSDGSGKLRAWINGTQFFVLDDIECSSPANHFLLYFAKELFTAPVIGNYRSLIHKAIPEKAFGKYSYSSISSKQIVKDMQRSGTGCLFFGAFGKESRHDLANAEYYLEAPAPYIGSSLNPIRQAEYSQIEDTSPASTADYKPLQNTPGVDGISIFGWIKPDLGGGTILEMAGVSKEFQEGEVEEPEPPPEDPPGGPYEFYPDPNDQENPEWFKTPKEYFEYYPGGSSPGHAGGDDLILHDKNSDGSPYAYGYEGWDYDGNNVYVQNASGESPYIDGRLGEQLLPLVTFSGGETTEARLLGIDVNNTQRSSSVDPVVVLNASPIIQDCVISGNGGGAGIYGDNAAPRILLCDIFGHDRGLVFSNSAPIVSGSRVHDNSSSEDGSGIYYNTCSNFTIDKTWIYGNSTMGSGGGAYFVDCSGVITNTNIYLNTANAGNGGGVCVTVTGAQKNMSLIATDVVDNNCIAGNGGGIYVGAIAKITCINVISYDNSPEAIYADTGSTTAITYSDIENGWTGTGNIDANPNFVESPGNPYRIDDDSPCFDAGTDISSIQYCGYDIEGNKRPSEDPENPGEEAADIGSYEWPVPAGYYGGGGDIHIYPGDDIQADGIDKIPPGGTIHVHPEPGGGGGTVYEGPLEIPPGKPFTLINAEPGEEITVDPGGSTSGYVVDVGPNVGFDTIIDGFTFGGGMRSDTRGIRVIGGSPTIQNCKFTNCGFTGNGGGAYVQGTNVKFISCQFTSNTTYGTGDGGGMYCDSASPLLQDCTFSGNTAARSGGGIYWKGYAPGLGIGAISGTSENAFVVQNNSASAGWGGGIYMENTGPTIANAYIYNNLAKQAGGGLFLNNYAATQAGSSFSSNNIIGNSTEDLMGGGMFVSGALTDFTAKLSDISSNHSNSYGGGVYLQGGTITLQNSQVTNNVALDVGGIYVDGADSTLVVKPGSGSTLFQGNTGGTIGNLFGYNGCTIRLEGSASTFPAKKIEIDGDNKSCRGVEAKDCNFYMQHARIRNCGQSGLKIVGGNGGYDTIIDNAVISNNGASASVGGGVWIDIPDGSIDIVNTAIFENSASTSGGGVYVNGDTLSLVTIMFSVIVDNSAGAGLVSNNSGSRINNSILWSNTGGDLVELSGSLILANNVVSQNPLFVSQATHNYHVTESTSPVIDAGSYPEPAPAEAAYDFDGEERDSTAGATIHIGLDENDVTASGNIFYVPTNYPTIQNAINNVPVGSTIIVEDGTYNENIDYIGKDLVIKAEHDWLATINGGSISNTVTFESGETNAAKLEGFIIQNGMAMDYGGGITISNNSNPVINHCKIISNVAPDGGGGIYISGSSPIITACTIGGADGDGNYCTGGPYSMGGGIYMINSSAVIGLLGSQNIISYNYHNNFKVDYGAGIYVGAGCNGASIKYNYIRYNIANYRGGGVYINSSSPIFSSNAIDHNSTLYEHAIGQTEPAGGGGVFMYDNASTNFQNNIIVQNSVSGSDGQLTSRTGGGGVYAHKCATFIGGSSISTKNYISGNSSDGHGGGVMCVGNHVTGVGPEIKFNDVGASGGYTGNTIISASSKRGSGGGIAIFSAVCVIKSNNIKSNYTDGDGGGGLYLSQASTTEVSSNTFDANGASNSAYAKGGGVYSVGSSANIHSNYITGCASYVYGGGIYTSGAAKINNNIIIYNQSLGWGGGIYAINAPEIRRNTVYYNFANAPGIDFGYGGGIVLDTGVGICTGNMVWQNFAYIGGGGIMGKGFLGGKIIHNTVIRNWTESGSGGGLGFFNGAYSEQITYIYNNIFHTNYTPNPGSEDTYFDVSYEANPFALGNMCVTSPSTAQFPYPPPGMIYDDPLLNNFYGDDPTNGDFDLSDLSPCLQMGDPSQITGITEDYHGDDRIQPSETEEPDIGADEHDYAIFPSGKITIRPVLPNIGTGAGSSFLDEDTSSISSGTGKISTGTWHDLIASKIGGESIRVEVELSGFLAQSSLDEMLPDGMDYLNSSIYQDSDYSDSHVGISYMRFFEGGHKLDAYRAIRGVLEFVFGDFTALQWTNGIKGRIRSTKAVLGEYGLDTPFHVTLSPIFREDNGTDLVIKSGRYTKVLYDKIVLEMVIQPNPSALLVSQQPERIGKLNTYGDLNKLVSSRSAWNAGDMQHTMDWDSTIKIMTESGLRRFTIPCWLGACLSRRGAVYNYTTSSMDPSSISTLGQDINVLFDLPVAGRPIYELSGTETRNSDESEIMWPNEVGKDDSFYIGEVSNLTRSLSGTIKCYIGRNPTSAGAGDYPQHGRLLSEWDGRSPIPIDIYITGDNIFKPGYSIGDKTSSLANFSIGYSCSCIYGNVSSDQVISTGFQPIYVSKLDASVGVARVFLSDVDLREIYDHVSSKSGSTSTLGDILLTVDYVTIKGPVTRKARVFSQDALL